jgi:STE24 endopeptidase
MSGYGYLILGILFLIDIFEIYLKYLNLRQIKVLKKKCPENVTEVFEKDKLEKALNYQEEKERLDIFSKIVVIPFFYGIFVISIVQSYSNIINNSFSGEFSRAIIFFISFIIFNYILSLPFNIYDTFVIEKKYGFNKMTPALYIKDTVISGIISLVLISVIVFAIVGFIKNTGNLWWFLGAVFTALFSFFITYIYPTFIAPLFNKFEPIDNEDLKKEVFNLSNKAEFPLDKIYKMDASKRSSHSNAYFTGFGKKKRIVLFDTLLKNHSISEILAILAHEIGHYKLGHIKKMLFISVVFIFIGFFFAGSIIDQQFIYNAFGFSKTIYIGLFICMILFAPFNFVIQPFLAFLSRKHEFEADNFAVKLIEKKDVIINTLIKLYKDNLANPMPHRLYKVFYYSHPTLLERIEEIKK